MKERNQNRSTPARIKPLQTYFFDSLNQAMELKGSLRHAGCYRLVIAAFCATVITSEVAFARLGEAEAQYEARYGVEMQDPSNQTSPLIDGAPHHSYHYQGWRIRAAFVDGVVAREVYQKLSATNASPLIKDFEMSAILEAEKGDGTWKERPSQMSLNPITGIQRAFERTLLGKIWIRTDGALAFGRPGLDTAVRLETSAAAQADARAKQQREQKQKAAVPQF